MMEIALVKQVLGGIFPNDNINECIGDIQMATDGNINHKMYRCKVIDMKKTHLIPSIECSVGKKKILHLLKYLVDDPHLELVITSFIIPRKDPATFSPPTPTTSQLSVEFRNELCYFKEKPVVRCKCGSVNTIFRCVQTRSCDEEAVLLVVCVDCSFSFTPTGNIRFENPSN